MKVIQFNTPDGVYIVPLFKVAEHRADNYVERGTKDHKEEIDWVLNDDFEGIDWLINNTDFEEWEDVATKVDNAVNVSLDDFWCSSDDFEIIEAKED